MRRTVKQLLDMGWTLLNLRAMTGHATHAFQKGRSRVVVARYYSVKQPPYLPKRAAGLLTNLMCVPVRVAHVRHDGIWVEVITLCGGKFHARR